LNGEHISDSEFIIDFLLKKFEMDVNNRYSREQLALATCVKLVLEEHCIWGLSLEKFVFNKLIWVDQSMHMPFLVRLYMPYAIKHRSEAQGMGAHTEKEIEQLVMVDLRAVSAILGENHFICGDRPCEYDCGIFAVLAQVVWGKPDSRYKKLFEEECRNLEEYCVRMRERYFPDWNDLLAK
jgi:glutathione S-transferase